MSCRPFKTIGNLLSYILYMDIIFNGIVSLPETSIISFASHFVFQSIYLYNFGAKWH